MEVFVQILKMFLVGFSLIASSLNPIKGGGDFEPSKPVEAGNSAKYVQIEAVDTGLDIYTPNEENGGYHYGPSMILNTDGSLDIWFASDGPGDIIDMVSYARYYDGGKSRSRDRIALKPSPGSHDAMWTCDPGVIKFGGYYYIGYTTTLDSRGVDNDVCVGRSKNPDGPFEKWTGTGWGDDTAPLIEFTGNSDNWGAGEPSFVLMGDKLYIYYSWNEAKPSTYLAIADATDENWPATLEYKGEVLSGKGGSADSADVKYLDEYGRFIAVWTEKRFSGDSYIAVWESFDGINFRQSSFIKANTAKGLHNCGISGRADGHIGEGDPVYVSYGYGLNWGDWATRLQEVKLSLADEPKTDDTTEENVAIEFEKRKTKAVADIVTVKAEKQEYNISKPEKIWVMAFDSDRVVFPLLTGTKFYDYDKSVIKIVGGVIYPVGEGSTRVRLCWHGYYGDFIVNVTKE